jgi:hypothetical protein
MDSVLLVDISDTTRCYVQAKAVESQRCLLDLVSFVDQESEADLYKTAMAALARVHQLVGQVMAGRLTVKSPVPKLQEELALEAAAKAAG